LSLGYGLAAWARRARWLTALNSGQNGHELLMWIRMRRVVCTSVAATLKSLARHVCGIAESALGFGEFEIKVFGGERYHDQRYITKRWPGELLPTRCAAVGHRPEGRCHV